jgi:hypothetical protein
MVLSTLLSNTMLAEFVVETILLVRVAITSQTLNSLTISVVSAVATTELASDVTDMVAVCYL